MLRFVKIKDLYGDYVRINADQIVVYFGINENRTKIFLTNGKYITVSCTEEELDKILECINTMEK